MWIAGAPLRAGQHGVTALRCTACLILMSLASCASVSMRSASELPATALTVIGDRTIIDDRPEFRALFCRMLRQSQFGSEDCGSFLWQLSDEKATAAGGGTESAADGSGAASAAQARVLIFGGAFGDCFPPWTTPFAGQTAAAERAGFSIQVVPLSGRSSSGRNAITVRERVLALPAGDARPLILIGYSKGAVDILESLARYPEVAARVAAVISISGSINGSPLAARYRRLYDVLLRKRKIGSCPPGDGRVLESLDRVSRLSWLSRNPLPRNVRYYSIVTFTGRPRIARILAHMQRILSKVSPRNDGQMLAEDQIVPGSALLGFANADHWAIALRMEDRFPILAHRRIGKHPFPQAVLLEAALRFVRRDIRHPQPVGRSPPVGRSSQGRAPADAGG